MTQHPLSDRYKLAFIVRTANDTEDESIFLRRGCQVSISVGSLIDDCCMLCSVAYRIVNFLEI